MTPYEKRWLEIEYYFYVWDLITETGDIAYMLQLIEILSFFGTIDKDKLSKLTLDIMTAPRFKPTYEETAVIVWWMKNNLPANISKATALRKKFGIEWQVQYNIYERDQKNPRVFYPKLNDEQLEEISNFWTSLDHLTRMGI
jgi:hypothetical protein